jgi:hypothetical protein
MSHITLQAESYSHVYHTKCSGEVLLNPHGPVLYGPAKHAVFILKRITTAHSFALNISLSQSRPSHKFITPGPDRLPPVEFMAGLHTAARSNTPPKGRCGSTFEDIPARLPMELRCYVLLVLLRRLNVPSVLDLHLSPGN